MDVLEQRGSNMLQSVFLAATLASMPAVRLIPTAVLWGYFPYMAIESLPGSQLFDPALLLLTDPRRRHLVLEQGHTPYMETVSEVILVLGAENIASLFLSTLQPGN
jgi:hypothetical protein